MELKSLQDVRYALEHQMLPGGSPIGRGVALGVYYALENAQDPKACVEAITDEMTAIYPTMAFPFTIRKLLLQRCAMGSDDLREDLRALCMKIIHHSEQAYEKAAAYAADIIKDGDKIYVHSYSTSMAAALVAAAAAGKHFSLFTAPVLPISEINYLVDKMAPFDIPITIAADMSLYDMIKACDYGMSGADRVCRNGDGANHFGTGMAARLASDLHKPFYMITEIFKFDPTIPCGEEMNLTSLDPKLMLDALKIPGAETNPKITLVFHSFEPVKADWITAYVTEEGCVDPKNAMAAYDRLMETMTRSNS